jgi:hypothetical protein
VSVSWPNFVRGRLVDRQGKPLTEVEIRLFEGSTEKHRDRDGSGDGTFTFSRLGLGPCKVTVRDGFQHHQFYVDVARGPNELGDVVVPFHERVGPISGRLRSAQGTPNAWVVLSDLVSGVSHETETFPDPAGAGFEFDEVPLGNYRLTLYPCDGLRYPAPTLLVSPPSTGIEFIASGEVDPLQFRANDAQSGREIEASPWVLQSGRWCGPEVSRESADVVRWILLAKDHRPASGRALETALVDARLEPGWGCALFFTEGSGGDYPAKRGPIAGVEVRADGLVIARSDQDGLALVSLPRKPEQVRDEEVHLECGLDGWVVEYGDLVVGNSVVLGPDDVCASIVLRRE